MNSETQKEKKIKGQMLTDRNDEKESKLITLSKGNKRKKGKTELQN